MQLKITFYFLLLLKIFQCKNENKPSFGEEDANEASSNDKYAECSINSYETNLLSKNHLMASMLYIIKKKKNKIKNYNYV